MESKDLIDEAKQFAIKKAKAYTDNITIAGLTINDILNNGLDIKTLVNELNQQANNILSGDTKGIESLLVTQAQTLNIIFNNMVSRAMDTNRIDTMKAYMDVALRAQNQCRKTLMALSDIKHPQHPTFVKQQNVAINQQVNNAGQLEVSENSKLENELLEVKYESMDTRASTTPIITYSEMEALAAWRSKDGSR